MGGYYPEGCTSVDIDDAAPRGRECFRCFEAEAVGDSDYCDDCGDDYIAAARDLDKILDRHSEHRIALSTGEVDAIIGAKEALLDARKAIAVLTRQLVATRQSTYRILKEAADSYDRDRISKAVHQLILSGELIEACGDPERAWKRTGVAW